MSHELKVAIEAAKEAGKIFMHYYADRSSLVVESKGGVDRVSNADKESEQKIREILKRTFPNHRIVGEEFGDTGEKSNYVWYVDPLCGTISFLHGFPEFGISIGLAQKDEILLGVCFLPVVKELFTAEKGKGAFLNGKKISVSKIANWDDAMFGTDYSYDLNKRKGQLDYFEKMTNKAQYVKITASLPYALSAVARGRLEGYFELYVPPEHRIGGLLIVEEAGGRVTNLRGEKLAMNDEHIVATNGLLHDETIRILNEK